MGVYLVFCPQIANAKGILKNFLIEPFVPHKQVSTPLKEAFKSLWASCLAGLLQWRKQNFGSVLLS